RHRPDGRGQTGAGQPPGPAPRPRTVDAGRMPGAQAVAATDQALLDALRRLTDDLDTIHQRQLALGARRHAIVEHLLATGRWSLSAVARAAGVDDVLLRHSQGRHRRRSTANDPAQGSADSANTAAQVAGQWYPQPGLSEPAREAGTAGHGRSDPRRRADRRAPGR